MPSSKQSNAIQLTFDESFIENYAHKLVTIPEVAIIELIANCWDAGATKVKIQWPEFENGEFEISDNGSGMTFNEFSQRWGQFNYNRRRTQPSSVKIPGIAKERKVYGKNGKGRHSLFCFSDVYRVETCKNGERSVFDVKRGKGGEKPYSIEVIEQTNFNENGTKISCKIDKNYRKYSDIKELIGTKFSTEPNFEIFINNEKIELEEILNNSESFHLEIENEGSVEIYLIDSQKIGRTSLLNGVAYWVNNRSVGDHSWKDYEGILLDGRTVQAKRYTIIVKADFLENEVLEDWTGFYDTDRSNRIQNIIKIKIFEIIGQVMKEVRTESKKEIVDNNRQYIRQLGNFGKEKIGLFIDEVQKKCPTINKTHFSQVVKILANMETSQSKYRLLQQLGTISPEEIDQLSDILENWSVIDAKIVLDELHWRLELIKKLESLVDDPTTDELHELQPLIQKGLWIFGPEYDTMEFLPNRWLLTIIKKMYGHSVVETPQKRPDFVVLPDTSISVHTRDDFDSKIEQVKGYDKILIIELKKGKSEIGLKELDQARDYAIKIKNSAEIVNQNPKIICFVIGTSINCENANYGNGSIELYPRSYHIILRQAEKRTFNLINKIKDLKNIEDKIYDKEIRESLEQEDITTHLNFGETAVLHNSKISH